MQKKDIPS
ncbi:unnamed protein product, partial [Cuscuta europaea]